MYVHEKTRDYFIVKDTATTNSVFSYIISAYRKGYESKRFDSGSDIEISAVIDEQNKTTDVEIQGSDAAISAATNATIESTNLITGNVINEAGLETDLSNILEPASNTSATTDTSSAETTQASVIFDNSSNAQISNASGDNATNKQSTSTVQKQTQEQDDDIENKFTINSIDEDEIINEIEEKTKLDKDKIKRSIKFKKTLSCN
ncbi:hypothetical protein HYY70_00255 [Candidatus Woesearchaeota archaeon]|nr:hypothetical protein [Candidatus Woesearchaeota archaeon]